MNTNNEDSESRPNSYSKSEIEALLEQEQFVYQQIALPYGLHTTGADRSPTARMIFPDRMQDASVLEIGCCYGYFLYEARRRGATKTVGLEINPARLRHARLLRDIRGEDVVFSDEDFHDVCRRETFDYVLMLNVIHHLADPIAALRVAAACAGKKLIVEFPTPMDKKFRKLLFPGVPYLLNRLPVIGVGPKSVTGQTYVFTRTAMTRALMEHERYFRTIDYYPSPMKNKGRLIAVCSK